jgi:hypothetical protein
MKTKLVKKMAPLVVACALLPVVATAQPEPASGEFFPASIMLVLLAKSVKT